MLHIIAPLKMRHEQIRDFIYKKEEWIQKTLKKVSKKVKVLPDIIEEGAIIYLLGKAHLIKIQNSLRNYIEYTEKEIIFNTTKIHQNHLIKMLKKFLSDKAEKEIMSIFKNTIERAAKIGIYYIGTTEIKPMKSKWGACYNNGNIKLNLSLIHTHPSQIDYVCCHELAHLKEFNHSPAFYDWLQKLCPFHKSEKQKLHNYSL
jgi:predicted metal-dependent hydrolase